MLCAFERRQPKYLCVSMKIINGHQHHSGSSPLFELTGSAILNVAATQMDNRIDNSPKFFLTRGNIESGLYYNVGRIRGHANK